MKRCFTKILNLSKTTSDHTNDCEQLVKAGLSKVRFLRLVEETDCF